MAIFHFTTATSRFTSAPGADAFGPPTDDTPGADTLIVDPGAFLISTGVTHPPDGAGADLAGTGAWTVTVNGSIVGPNAGIFLAEGNPAVSTIKIGVDGEVQGVNNGILVESSANINNAGIIACEFGGFSILIQGGTHTITNSGTIIGTGGHSIIELGASSIETVRNSGTISGDIDLGGGNDTVTDFAIVGGVMKSGTIMGTVDLGAGNDKFSGGANPETVQAGLGADTVSLGGGNDTYIATGNGNFGADGIDTVSGGADIDTYDASAATSDLGINLDIIGHNLLPFASFGFVAANTAMGLGVAGANTDKITGFENAVGGTGQDNIYGSAAANVLEGGAGVDRLFGFGGNDTLIGGSELDVLFGGAGKDTLTGGVGNDFFSYSSITESGPARATRDVITDFNQAEGDKIDLELIDANRLLAGNQDFNFIGNNTPFDGHPGQLHAFLTAIGQMVEGDVNGDAKADFSIEIADPTHAITLSNTSFSL